MAGPSQFQPQARARLTFGPFEVDASAHELRKNGVRIKLSGQPFQILLALLAHPGEVVTRERLREEVWGEGTYVDFEHGLNAVVNKLRRALNDSAEKPRYIETIPGCGYRFIGALARAEGPPVPSNGISPTFVTTLKTTPVELPPRRSGVQWWGAAAIAAGVAVAFGLGLHFDGGAAVPPSWKLNPLTSDAGLSYGPALSRDGKLVAYSSDRNAEGEQDLYVQQVAGGQPIRLTFDGAGNTMPDFSPDASRIVFRSNREGGGIYEIPTFGGDVRLLARDGLNPRFSPDGSQVAYWVGSESIAALVPGSGALWVVSTAGGQPRRVGLNFTAARYPVWSPDGKHLLCIGYTSGKAFENSILDWWVLDPNGGEAVKTGAYELLVKNRLHTWAYGAAYTQLSSLPKPECWPVSSRISFTAVSEEASNLWELDISPLTGKASGGLRKLTTGAGNELEPSCAAAGTVAFTKGESRRDVWSLPFDLNHGTPTGALERITHGSAFREHVSLSADGRHAAFASDQDGTLNIWTRDLWTGKESRTAGSSLLQRYPVSDASGARIAFSVFDKEKRTVYLSVAGGTAEKLCEGCLRATDWSRDEKSLLVFGGSPYEIDLLDVAWHRQSPLVRHPTYNLLYARYSPDNRWVSFTARTAPNRARIFIAPVGESKPVPESTWLPIAEVSAEDWAVWSPDGQTLYFTSGRDGHICIWGQRIAAGSHRPVGEAFAAQHFHGRAVYQQGGWSATQGRIAIVLREETGNIWMMSRSQAR